MNRLTRLTTKELEFFKVIFFIFISLVLVCRSLEEIKYHIANVACDIYPGLYISSYFRVFKLFSIILFEFYLYFFSNYYYFSILLLCVFGAYREDLNSSHKMPFMFSLVSA